MMAAVPPPDFTTCALPSTTAALGGSQVGLAVTNSAVGVTNGIFIVALDFGATVFDGTARWL